MRAAELEAMDVVLVHNHFGKLAQVEQLPRPLKIFITRRGEVVVKAPGRNRDALSLRCFAFLAGTNSGTSPGKFAADSRRECAGGRVTQKFASVHEYPPKWARAEGASAQPDEHCLGTDPSCRPL